jgi:hypothetical protein
MNLSVRQTRQMLLAGTVAFPRPFPSAGIISFETGSVIPDRDQGPADMEFLVVQELGRGRKLTTHSVRPADVRAIYVPGRRKDKTFRISMRREVRDFDHGEWFFDQQIAIKDIAKQLQIDERRLLTRESVLRGIVFVRGNRPVIRSAAYIATARELQYHERRFCTGCWEHEKMRCTGWCTGC